MPEIPKEALQAATPAKVIENALSVMGVDAPEDGATVVLGHLDRAGLVVVSAEDVDICVNWGAGAHPRTAFYQFNAALARLRAALPEEK